MNNQNKTDEFLNNLVFTAISQVKELSKSKTIIGEPIVCPDNTTIIPVSKVSVGYVVGGGEYNSINKKSKLPSYGGSGGGVSISPIGFIVEKNNEINFVNIENKNVYQTVLNMVNAIIKKLDKTKGDNIEKV